MPFRGFGAPPIKNTIVTVLPLHIRSQFPTSPQRRRWLQSRPVSAPALSNFAPAETRRRRIDVEQTTTFLELPKPTKMICFLPNLNLLFEFCRKWEKCRRDLRGGTARGVFPWAIFQQSLQWIARSNRGLRWGRRPARRGWWRGPSTPSSRRWSSRDKPPARTSRSETARNTI